MLKSKTSKDYYFDWVLERLSSVVQFKDDKKFDVYILAIFRIDLPDSTCSSPKHLFRNKHTKTVTVEITYSQIWIKLVKKCTILTVFYSEWSMLVDFYTCCSFADGFLLFVDESATCADSIMSKPGNLL
jgi:hypothetical protein